MPWASDFLPHEIEDMKHKLSDIWKKKNKIYWIGTIGDGLFGNINQIDSFRMACVENDIIFIHNDPWINGLDSEKCSDLISTSFMSPAIVGQWQQDKGYIPCRIFISITNGQMGITNSLRTYELFEKKIVYNSDTYQLFYDAKKKLDTWNLEDQYELMDIIKEKHTYINRIHVLLDLLNMTTK